jgi:hypothetical protein
VRTKTFIRKRRRSIIDIGYGTNPNHLYLEREALNTKQKQLIQQDKGNKPKRACPPTDEEINILYNRNVF